MCARARERGKARASEQAQDNVTARENAWKAARLIRRCSSGDSSCAIPPYTHSPTHAHTPTHTHKLSLCATHTHSLSNTGRRFKERRQSRFHLSCLPKSLSNRQTHILLCTCLSACPRVRQKSVQICVTNIREILSVAQICPHQRETDLQECTTP